MILCSIIKVIHCFSGTFSAKFRFYPMVILLMFCDLMNILVSVFLSFLSRYTICIERFWRIIVLHFYHNGSDCASLVFHVSWWLVSLLHWEVEYLRKWYNCLRASHLYNLTHGPWNVRIAVLVVCSWWSGTTQDLGLYSLYLFVSHTHTCGFCIAGWLVWGVIWHVLLVYIMQMWN